MDLACLHIRLLLPDPLRPVEPTAARDRRLQPTHPAALCPSAPQLTSEEAAGGALRLSLNLPLRGIRTSLLSLAVAADNVTFVVNRAPAQITAVEVRWARLVPSPCGQPGHPLPLHPRLPSCTFPITAGVHL